MHTNLTWEQDIGLNGVIAKPLWLYYRYTGDTTFLNEVAYPVLRECARFYQAYLSEGDDERLHVIPSVSPEHWGLTDYFLRNKDSISALALIRYIFRVAVEAAGILNTDSSESKKWQQSLTRLADYPTYQTSNGPVWGAVQGTPPEDYEYNIPVPLSPVFWGDDVGLDSSPEQIAMAMRTLETIKVEKIRHNYLQQWVYPRLGIMKEGASIGTANFLHSYQSIRIFSAIPNDTEAQIEGLYAEGGFRIGAKISADKEVSPVEIKSHCGGTCRFFNPWKTDLVAVICRGISIPNTINTQGIITFETDKVATYLLKPLVTY